MSPQSGAKGVSPSSTVSPAMASGEPDRAQALQALTDALKTRQADPRAASGAAQALLACLEGARLDLNRIDPAWRALVFDLPDAAWAALDRCAAAQGAKGIGSLSLPESTQNAQLQAALERVNRLPQLTELMLRVPESGRSMTLKALSGGPVKVVEIDFWRPSFQEVLAPDTLKVRARRSQPEHLTQKDAPRLSLTDAKGAPTTSGPVPDLGYFRRPTDFIRKRPQDPSPQVQAMLVNLNGKVPFDSKHAQADRIEGTADKNEWIYCRNIAVAMIQSRRAYLLQKAAGRAADTQTAVESKGSHRSAGRATAPSRFSFGPFSTPDELAHTVSKTTQIEFHQIQRAQVPIVFTAAGFGSALSDQFGQMLPGQARHFLLLTDNHALVVELQCKDKAKVTPGKLASEFVILLIDPNATATAWRTVVSDLDRLRTRGLDEWLLNANLQRYLGNEPRTALMYRWAEPDTDEWDTLRARPGGIYGFEGGMTAGRAVRHLRATLEAGHAQAVHESVRLLFASDKLKTSSQLRIALGAQFHEPGKGSDKNALTQAAGLRKPAAFAAYLRAILFTDDPRLNSATRLELARAWPHFECTAVYARTLLATPLIDIEAVHERFTRVLALSARSPANTPLPSDAAPHHSHQFWYDIAHEMAVCPDLDRALPSHERSDTGCVVMNRCAVAAILCATLEAPIPPTRRKRLLTGLGTPPKMVLTALVEASAPHESYWGARLLRALRAPMLQEQFPSFRALVDPAFVPPAQAEPARQLLAANTVWMASTGLCPQHYKEAGLRALHLDSNPTWMVCTADEPIPELVGLRLTPGTRLGPDMSFEGLRYLLPVSQLHAGSAKAEADHKASGVPTTSTHVPRPQQWKIVDA